ncbi:unnamed protein product, partial [Urochloa humidicola]
EPFEDSDVVKETFEEVILEKETEEMWNMRNLPTNHGYSTDSSLIYTNDYAYYDSDREPQCWKHGH